MSEPFNWPRQAMHKLVIQPQFAPLTRDSYSAALEVRSIHMHADKRLASHAHHQRHFVPFDQAGWEWPP